MKHKVQKLILRDVLNLVWVGGVMNASIFSVAMACKYGCDINSACGFEEDKKGWIF